MINVLFFAQIRELTGCEHLELQGNWATVDALRAELSQRGKRWQHALMTDNLLTAVNHTLVPLSHPLMSGDEVAFFPPVTGG